MIPGGWSRGGGSGPGSSVTTTPAAAWSKPAGQRVWSLARAWSAVLKSVPRRSARRRSDRRKTAPRALALRRLASRRSASVKSASRRSVSASRAPRRSASAHRARWRIAVLRSAGARSAHPACTGRACRTRTAFRRRPAHPRLRRKDHLRMPDELEFRGSSSPARGGQMPGVHARGHRCPGAATHARSSLLEGYGRLTASPGIHALAPPPTGRRIPKRGSAGDVAGKNGSHDV